MNKEEFRDRIMELFDEAGITIRDHNELEAESLQYIEFVSAVEDEFEVDLPDEFMAFSAIRNIDVFIDSIYELLEE